MAETPKLRLIDIDETVTDPKTDAGRIAAGVREGRRREKAEQAQANAKREGEHKGQIEGLVIAHEKELERTAARERAVGHHRAAWLYGLPALIIGGAVSLYALIAMQNYTAETLANNFREQAMTGAIIQANQAPERCIPGETLGDGRICPQAAR